MPRHASVFVVTFCVLPLIGMVQTGLRARSEPIKFSMDWIPCLLVGFAILGLAWFALAATAGYVIHGRRRIEGRSLWITFAAGAALGACSAFSRSSPPIWYWIGGAVLLAPVLFRRIERPASARA